jgi:hypothetical protein
MKKYQTKKLHDLSTFVGMCKEEGASVVRIQRVSWGIMASVVHRDESMIYLYSSTGLHGLPSYDQVKLILEAHSIIISDTRAVWTNEVCNEIAGLCRNMGV